MIQKPTQHRPVDTQRLVHGPPGRRRTFEQSPAVQAVRSGQARANLDRITQKRANQAQAWLPPAIVIMQIAECTLVAEVDFRCEAEQQDLALERRQAKPFCQNRQPRGVASLPCGFDLRPVRSRRVVRGAVEPLIEQMDNAVPADRETAHVVVLVRWLARDPSLEQCIEPKPHSSQEADVRCFLKTQPVAAFGQIPAQKPVLR